MVSSGLEGVVVADSHISYVDGQAGRLILRGHSLEQLEPWTFEEVGAMLWQRPLTGLGEARLRVAPWIRELVPLATHLSPIEWLRFALDRLPSGTAIDWVAALGVALALRRNPQAQPDATLGHVEDVARMAGLTGSDGLRRYWVCVAEHGMNASTFTARVVASTRAGQRAPCRPRWEPCRSASRRSTRSGAGHAGGVGKSPRSGCLVCSTTARWPAPDGLRAPYLSGARPPRRSVAPGLPVLDGAAREAGLCEHMEKLATQALSAHKPGRVLQTNVEYYTALLLDALGFDRSEFTAVFACGRVLGWLAHIFEQEAEGRLIRPEVRYVGPMD
jgi:citrate synthase